jgi:hypothetical protein
MIPHAIRKAVDKMPTKPVGMPTTRRRGPQFTWKLVIGVIVAAVVLWQVAQGAFVKSVGVPGAGEISFFPKYADDSNSIRQLGSDNRAAIRGRSNIVHQDGYGNTATIGEMPANRTFARPAGAW